MRLFKRLSRRLRLAKGETVTLTPREFIVSEEGIPTLLREKPESLTPKEFIEREEALSNIALREKAVRFLFIAYGGLLTVTMAIILLEGFQLWGFSLDLSFLSWLGAATVGEVAGLAALVYGALFRKS